MSQQNTELEILNNKRITDLREIKNLGITEKHVNLYDRLSQIYDREDSNVIKQNRSKLAIISFYVSLVLLGIGIILWIISFVFLFSNPSVWASLIVTITGLVEGGFFAGFFKILHNQYKDESNK